MEPTSDIQADASAQPACYTVPKLEGAFTLQELVAMDISKDPRLSKVRRRDLPEAFWEERRRALNRRRTLRQKASRKARSGAAGEEGGQEGQQGQQQSGEEGDLKEGLQAPPARATRTEEERRQAVQAHLEQVGRVEAALASGLRVVVDCSLCQAGASWREQRSLVKQLQLSVGANKKAQAPLCLHFVGLTGRAREFAVGSMNALRWPAHVSEAPALELFPPSQLVVLSPDAEQPLLELDPQKVYVIGGLVDRSVAKNATASHAEQHGIQCARLPIAEFLGQTQGAAAAAPGAAAAAAPKDAGAPEGAVPKEAAAAQWWPEGEQQQEQRRQQRQSGTRQQQEARQGEAQCTGEDGQGVQQGGTEVQLEDESQQACQLAGSESCSTAAAAAAISSLSIGISSSSGRSTAATTAPAAASSDAQPATSAGACELPTSSMRQAKKKKEDGAAGGFVLNITDVVDILLAVNAGEGWGNALRRAIPLRKQLQRFGSEAVLAGED